MDSLGERIIRDRAKADDLIRQAKEHERLAREKYAEAHEVERHLELAKLAQRG